MKTLKLLHTSDLHLGKRLENIPLIEDQVYILDQILDIAERNRVDAVLVAGDVYDRSVPPVEATTLLSTTLERLAELGIPTFLIGGNHDSIERLSFGSSMFKKSDVYISNYYDGHLQRETLHDEFGELDVYLMPYITPMDVRMAHGVEVPNLREAFKVVFESNPIDTSRRNVLLAHQFAMHTMDDAHYFEEYLGGTEDIGVDVFEGLFDYVALGHVHKPLWVVKGRVRYCGSPLKYSIKDVANENSVTIVDFKGKGDVSFQEVVLEPLRNLRRLRGTLEDITKNAVDTDDYVEVTLTDEEHIMNAMEKVRNLYPNVLRLAFDNSRTQTTEPLSNSANEVEERSMLELFADFFKDAYQQNLYDHPNYLDIVNKAIESVERSVLE